MDRDIVLVLEDEPLTAIDLSDELERQGLTPLVAPTLYEAFERLRLNRCCGAVVSNRVQGRRTKAARNAIRSQGIPLVMYSTNVRHLLEKPFPVLLKPSPPALVVCALTALLPIVVH